MIKTAQILDTRTQIEVNHFLDDYCSGIEVDEYQRPIPDPETFVRNMARLYREGDIK